VCPACGQPLIALELEGVEIDYCAACGGVWLDAGELEQIAELAGVAPGPLSAVLGAAVPGPRGRRRCPRCRRRLRTVMIGEAASVRLDRCPLGHGLWFDAGELRTLISSFARGESGAVAAFLGDVLRCEFDAGPKGER